MARRFDNSRHAHIEAAWATQAFFAEDGVERVFFTSGGSDSVDTSLRLARQYHRLRGAA